MTDADGLLAARFAATRDDADDADWNDVLARAEPLRWRPRPATLVLAVALAVVVVAPALAAFHGQIARLWSGPPPPPAQSVLSHLDPGLTASGARGVLELTTSAGVPVLLVVSNGPSGGCLGYVAVENSGVADPLPTSFVCPVRKKATLDPFLVEQSGRRIGSVWVQLVSGQIPNGVASLEFRGAGGETEPIATGEGYFFGEVPTWSPPIDLVALDANGNKLASQPLDTTPPPDPAGPRTTITSDTVDGATFAASWYPATADRTCVDLEVGASSLVRCLANSATGVLLAGPVAWPSPDGKVTTVLGTVPLQATSVQIEFPDGSHAAVPARNGGFLYAAEHAPLDPHGTTTVQALDASGNVVTAATTR